MRARRKWGQHWLVNDALADALVEHLGVRGGEPIVEIGPGTGRLTAALLRRGARVVAVEIDPECCRRLAALPTPPGRLEIIQADILAAHERLPWSHAPLRLVGNLPYYLSSPILRWTLARGNRVLDAHYMLQLEVAQRLAALPGSRRYGMLSVLARAVADVRILRRLPPGAFRPPPGVESAFVRLRPRPDGRPFAEAELRPLEVGFGHRRKTLARALRHGGWRPREIAAACRDADIDPGTRAERLDVAEWRRLAAALPEPRE